MRRARTGRSRLAVASRRLGIQLLAAAVIVGLGIAGWQAIKPRPTPHASSAATELAPPRAVGDVLTKTDAVGPGVGSAPSDAVLIGRTSGVRLLRYGFVSHYGSGPSARSAPDGYRLLAFVAQPIAGEDAAQSPVLSVLVNGTKRGPLVVTSSYLVVAVPPSSSQVDLLLDDSGVTQSVSLLSGKPSSTNPVVCTRTNRTAVVNATRDVTLRVKSGKSEVGMTSGTLTVSQVTLSYWGQNGSHPGDPRRAYLHIEARVTLPGDKTGYGAEAGLLSVIAGGTSARARNLAPDTTTEVDDVVEVPAGLTSGVIDYSGTLTTSKGTITVSTPVSIPFRIAAG